MEHPYGEKVRMKARYHVALSVALSLPFLSIGEHWMALTCLLSGIFIDVDHLVDYYVSHGKFTLSITELSNEMDTDMYICPLHSWEFLTLLFLFSLRFNFLVGAVWGVLTHIIADMITNPIHFRNVFLVVRMRKKWKT